MRSILMTLVMGGLLILSASVFGGPADSTCDICKIKFSTPKEWQDHVRENHNFKCPKCAYHLQTQEELEKHLQEKHGGES